VSDPSTISWAIVSHTNIGKTSLARTLLRREIGEVADQAHTTDESESHELLAVGDYRLLLWDTPGFGDSARLLRRLRAQRHPVGWLLAQVWDRIADRPLFCGQQAVATVRAEADLVLYLVSAAESPEEAGYVPLEMELLAWTEVPVVLLLNQTGESAAEELEALAERWRAASRGWPAVRGVLPLDAHRRSWLEEGVLLEESELWIAAAKRPAHAALLAEWRRRARARLDDSAAALAGMLAALLHHRETFAGSRFSPAAKRAARERIRDRVEARCRGLLGEWLALHGLAGELAERLEADWELFVDSGEVWLDTKRLGIGGALSGAATGALIDAKTLGASFGAGAVVGGILGGIAGWGLGGWIAEHSARGRHLRVGPAAIEALLARLLAGLLAISHHGRGRGEVRAERLGLRFAARVESELALRRAALASMWERGRAEGAAAEAETARLLVPPLRQMIRALLAADSPRVAETLARIEGAQAT
jgi:hypothetical protein